MTSLRRRLDDARCAFLHGHSRRDWDRVRVRRLLLLTQRSIARLDRDIVEDETGILASGWSPVLRSLRGHAQRLDKGFERYSYGFLLKHIELQRASLRSHRLKGLADVEAGGNLFQSAFHYVESLRVPPPEPYGRLYEGLAEKRASDHFFRQFGFYRLDRHHVFSQVFQRVRLAFDRLIHRASSGPP